MCDFIIPVICFYYGKSERIETYVRNKTVIVPLDVQIDYTFDQLLPMIYSRTSTDKERLN